MSDRKVCSERIGDWIQTFSGRQFWPLDPRPEEIFIEDIAHALSNICRFGGHCKKFYSVAEHSYLVSTIVPEEDALSALLHDAPEAYILDIPTPFKKYLVGYQEIETRIWLAVSKAFKLPTILSAAIKNADRSVLFTEKIQIMEKQPDEWFISGEPADVAITCLSPQEAKDLFLKRYYDLLVRMNISYLLGDSCSSM